MPKYEILTKPVDPNALFSDSDSAEDPRDIQEIQDALNRGSKFIAIGNFIFPIDEILVVELKTEA